MSDATLLRMAREIARNLASQSAGDAAAATAEHLRNFWSPSMRRTLLQLVESGSAVDSTVRDAVALLRQPR